MRNSLLILLMSYISFPSEASLLVAPTRISLSDKQRVTTVALKHLGSRVGKYRISLIFNRMTENGSLQEVTDVKPEERPAVKYIKFSPRIAVLSPNIEQVIRVMAIPPANLMEGEYRAHLLFEPTDDTEGETTSPSSKPQSKNEIGMHLEAKVSIAIPVVYSHGQVNSMISLLNPRVLQSKTNGANISVEIHTKGNAFPRGDLKATYVSENQEPKLLGLLKGLPLYSERVRFSIPIRKEINLKNLGKGTLRVEFLEPDEGQSRELRKLASVERRIATISNN